MQVILPALFNHSSFPSDILFIPSSALPKHTASVHTFIIDVFYTAQSLRVGVNFHSIEHVNSKRSADNDAIAVTSMFAPFIQLNYEVIEAKDFEFLNAVFN